MPPDIEEHVADFYERGDYDRAGVLFRFLIDCFDGYAEGYNYLGLIALHRERLEEAIERFRKGMELGRKQFPKRMARSRYWTNLSTRRYMRTMRNLTLAFCLGWELSWHTEDRGGPASGKRSKVYEDTDLLILLCTPRAPERTEHLEFGGILIRLPNSEARVTVGIASLPTFPARPCHP